MPIFQCPYFTPQDDQSSMCSVTDMPIPSRHIAKFCYDPGSRDAHSQTDWFQCSLFLLQVSNRTSTQSR